MKKTTKAFPSKRASLPSQEASAAAEPPPPPAAEVEAGPFFSRVDWSAFWVATLIAFGVYVLTLAPTVTLEDSGELATAGAYLGVPHPPGYPIWTIIVWLFTKLFWFVRYHGQPNPAWSIAFASAFFGALASGLASLLICRSGRDMLRGIKSTTEVIGVSTESLLCWAGGVAGSLVFAFSPVIWSQSVIVEVYSLNAFFLVLILLLAYMWLRRPSPRLLYVTALMFGLGMTNYQVLLLVGLTLAVIVFVKDRQLFRDLLIVGVPYGVVMGLMQFGGLPPIVHPTHVTASIYMALNVLALLLAYFLLPRGKEVALTIFFVQAGLAVYGFMPIASEFNPPMNWAYPRTWEGFKHAITRGQYEKIVPTEMFSARFVRILGYYLSDLRGTFTLPVAILGFLPFAAWGATLGGRRFKGLFVAVGMTVAAVGFVFLEEFLAPTGQEIFLLTSIYRVLIFGMVLLLVVGGYALVIEEVREMVQRLVGRLPTPLSERIVIGLGLLGSAAIAVGYVYKLTGKLLAPGGSIGDNAALALLIVAPFALAGLIGWLMLGPARLQLDVDRTFQKWILGTLSGFLVMSVLLIILADPKGDIQDAFIQRVKFISSHALFSFWVGYGIIFGLACVDTLTRGNRLVTWAGVGAAMLLPCIPILENAYNKELVRTSGGAEQNGHDFGWQFGNYELRGAAAIREELAPDEEPLPNPEYPPEMGYRAVFFGGTDPGRFVPTYMIYSAKVRSDVYLITQNALADNTYMSVMRDLYGDEIWIPSVRDGNSAFQKYVEDVNAGRIAPSAEIQIQNGRVSVQGVGGVMLINGILCQMIFDHCKAKHDFYVEESYVIQWMYPYLEPHGLIMKINSEPLPGLSAEVVRNDMDFWDWYARRLVGNSKFTRDVCARKSFSKLRSAIAGTYVFRGQFDVGERAFKEAVALYPLSPEASFRLADLYLRWGRAADAVRVMETFIEQDPGNDRAAGFLAEIRERDKLMARKGQIEAELSKGGGANVKLAFELAELYRRLGDEQRFMAIATSLLNTPSMPAPVYANLARVFAESRHFDQAETSLEKYIELVPANMNVWIDLAAMRLARQKPVETFQALQQAVKIGGEAAMDALKQDKRFDPIRGTPGFRQIVGQG